MAAYKETKGSLQKEIQQMKQTHEQLTKSLEQKTELLRTLTEEKDKLLQELQEQQAKADKSSSKPGLLGQPMEKIKGRKGYRTVASNQSNQKVAKAPRKGSVKAASGQAAASSLRTSLVDLTNIGSYEECLEALKQADGDDSRRTAIMGQVIGHLKNQLSKAKLQLTDLNKQMAQDKDEFESQLKKEKNLRQQAQDEKASMRIDLLQKIEEKDRRLAELEEQLGVPMMNRRFGCSPDFMNYRPET